MIERRWYRYPHIHIHGRENRRERKRDKEMDKDWKTEWWECDSER